MTAGHTCRPTSDGQLASATGWNLKSTSRSYYIRGAPAWEPPSGSHETPQVMTSEGVHKYAEKAGTKLVDNCHMAKNPGVKHKGDHLGRLRK